MTNLRSSARRGLRLVECLRANFATVETLPNLSFKFERSGVVFLEQGSLVDDWLSADRLSLKAPFIRWTALKE